MRRRWMAALVLGAGALPAGDLDVLPPDGPNPRTMVAEYLARQAAPYEAQRDAEIGAIQSVGSFATGNRKPAPA